MYQLSVILIDPRITQVGVEFGVADRLNIRLALDPRQEKNLNTKGLARASINGTMKSRDGRYYPVNGSEHDLFDFGESCKFYLGNRSALAVNC